ncbi:MAG TPA: hypothetical protein VLL08_01805 [Kineosporiaceae bacterium]|nr:hypothetical protein [Kineosporiaceae bacterium]
MLSLVFVGLIVAGAVGYFTRSTRVLPGDVYGQPSGRSYQPGYGVPPGEPLPASVHTSEARAEARHWVDLLGAGLSRLDGVTTDDAGRQRAARYALSDAAERHAAALSQLAQADTVHQIDLAARTALEGLHYLRAARTAFGLDPGPELSPPNGDGSVLTSTRRVVVQGQEYEASANPGQRTPYYYPGGTIRGTSVPAGWYSTPWWKTALVAGAAGVGSLLVVDALFGHGGGLFGHGGMGGGMDHGGMGGGTGGMDGGFGGGVDGGWF